MAAQTRLFLCLTDNYGVLLHDPESGATAAIDAPEAAPVDAALKASGWRLTDILVTHHHADHTGGIAELKQRHRCRVVAPHGEAARIPLVDATVREDDEVRVGSLKGRVLETPGHTAGHISYFFPADKLAFVGDTLFSIGCGRVIEGTPEMMWQSLLKLRGLPDDARIYCGHEYTQANIRFAKTIEPANATLNAREREVDKLLADGQPTIPSTIGAEKAANPFLRADVPEVAKSVGLAGTPAEEPRAQASSCKPHHKRSSAGRPIRQFGAACASLLHSSGCTRTISL
jgi:hydroxyacylglutathione hydrolase